MQLNFGHMLVIVKNFIQQMSSHYEHNCQQNIIIKKLCFHELPKLLMQKIKANIDVGITKNVKGTNHLRGQP